MSKNELTVPGRKRELVDIQDILKIPEKRAKLQNFIDEAVGSKIKVLNLNAQIKAIRDAAIEDLGIKPKMFNSLVSLFFNNNFEEKKAEIEQLETAIELMQVNSSLTHSSDED